jgi:mannose-6-phosphate isomerase-like protein (cupin superfamily)
MNEFRITKEQEQKLMEARKGNLYVKRPEDCTDYPIPELEASRVVIFDREIAGTEELTWLTSRFAGKTSFHNKHSHPKAEEIMYIARGKGIGGIGDKEVLLMEGDSIYVPKGVVHWFYNPYDEPCDMMTLYTRPSLKEAGYALESGKYEDISVKVEESWKQA